MAAWLGWILLGKAAGVICLYTGLDITLFRDFIKCLQIPLKTNKYKDIDWGFMCVNVYHVYPFIYWYFFYIIQHIESNYG